MRIWAHRGCSLMYPENTLLAFEKAAALTGLTGIELDIQLTRDGHMVVCHDETVDRTTNGSGRICELTLAELKRLNIDAGDGRIERIPTIHEVLELLEVPMKNGLLLNIELKNSIIHYEGMEEQIVSLVHERGLQDRVVYSSFYARSLALVKALDPMASIGVLDGRVSDCLYKLKGGCGADALHPNWNCMDLPPEMLEGYVVRGYAAGRIFPDKPTGGRLDIAALERKGITDVFLNAPENYL